MAKPSVSIMNSIFSACGMWKSGSSTGADRIRTRRRYGHRRSMYRFLFSPRWLGFHLLVIVGIVTMVNLGFWQLRRLDERKAFNAQVSERIADPPAPLDDVLTAGTDPDSVEWRSVTARGTYLPDEQFVVVNRSQDGIGGTMVVTPMQLADGRLLLVERGFEPGTTAAPAAARRHGRRRRPAAPVGGAPHRPAQRPQGGRARRRCSGSTSPAWRRSSRVRRCRCSSS